MEENSSGILRRNAIEIGNFFFYATTKQQRLSLHVFCLYFLITSSVKRRMFIKIKFLSMFEEMDSFLKYQIF